MGARGSSAIANAAMLVAEREMLRGIIGHQMIILYKRYVDDIWAMVEGPRERVKQVCEAIEYNLNRLDVEGEPGRGARNGGSIKVEGKYVMMSKTKKEGVIEKSEGVVEGEGVSVEYLDVDTALGWNDRGNLHLETSVFRKEAAADSYIHFTSAHSPAIKRGFIRGEATRFLRICSTEEGYERAWVRFKGALCGEKGKRRGRGYPTAFVEGAREGLLWKDRETVLQRLTEKKGERERGKGGWDGGMVIRAPNREGVEQWWRGLEGIRGWQGLGPRDSGSPPLLSSRLGFVPPFFPPLNYAIPG